MLRTHLELAAAVAEDTIRSRVLIRQHGNRGGATRWRAVAILLDPTDVVYARPRATSRSVPRPTGLRSLPPPRDHRQLTWGSLGPNASS